MLGMDMLFRSLGIDKEYIMQAVNTVVHLGQSANNRLAAIERRQKLIMDKLDINDDATEDAPSQIVGNVVPLNPEKTT